MTKLNIYLLIFVVVASCNDSNDTGRQSPAMEIAWRGMRQFTGDWYFTQEDLITVESWEMYDDSTLKGFSCTMLANDTLSIEHMTIKRIGDSISFIPIVGDQNNDLAVVFKWVPGGERVYAFENNSHDFPQKITYRFIGKDSMLAEISGFNKGVYKRIEFPYKRATSLK